MRTFSSKKGRANSAEVYKTESEKPYFARLFGFRFIEAEHEKAQGKLDFHPFESNPIASR